MSGPIIFRQGGLIFTWPDRSRRIVVSTKTGLELQQLQVGNVFDSSPATLDDVHDVIDEFCEGLK
jgi:hypothetical protein